MASAAFQLNTLDPRSLADLKRLAKAEGNSDAALRAASKQVESLFLGMMLKAMRDATPSYSPFESEQTRMVQGLYDQQLASDLAMSANGAGLADAIYRQLGGGRESRTQIPSSPASTEIQPRARPSTPSSIPTPTPTPTETTTQTRTAAALPPSVVESAALSASIAVTVDAARREVGKVPEHVRDFVASVWPHAQAASAATGIPAHFMVAQAALETGWGAKQPKNADGSPSYNLFNVKAGGNWTGATTADYTVAEHDAAAGWRRQKAAFRSYSSYAEAFSDYAELLKGNSRYAEVLGKRDAAAFAAGLQEAGYATDPMYADKLLRIIGGNTLKNALAATPA